MAQNLYLGALQVPLTQNSASSPPIDVIINCVKSNTHSSESLALQQVVQENEYPFVAKEYFADALDLQKCKSINVYSVDVVPNTSSATSRFVDAEEGSAEWLAASPLSPIIEEYSGKNILVTSCTGTNRACSLMALHLMRLRRSKLLSTLLFIADRWGPILTLSRYRKGLLDYAINNNLVESTPEEISRIIHLTTSHTSIVYGQPWSEPLSEDLFQDDADYDDYVDTEGSTSIQQLPEGHPQRLQEQKVQLNAQRRRRPNDKYSLHSDCGASDGDDLLLDLVTV